jgi:hypothetical protein
MRLFIAPPATAVNLSSYPITTATPKRSGLRRRKGVDASEAGTLSQAPSDLTIWAVLTLRDAYRTQNSSNSELYWKCRKNSGEVMSILERIRDTDRMLDFVDELARQMGTADGMEFQKRIAKDEPAAEVAFLEMAELLWEEHRDILQAFYRHYFHHLSKERQWRVSYTTAVSFLDRPAHSRAPGDII